MATTELAVIEPSGFVALAAPPREVLDIIQDNLGGQDLTERDLTRLTMPSGRAQRYRWEVPTLEGDSDAVEEVRGIVVLHKPTRGYWPLSIDEGGSGNPPSCSSQDGKVGRGKPWATKDDPYPEGDDRKQLCAECPHSQFGSAPDGRGQACSQRTMIFVLAETGFLPFVIGAPAKSLQPFRRYMMALGNQGIHYASVVTGFKLRKDSNQQGIEHAVLEPYLAARLDPAAVEAAKTYAAALRPQFEAVAADFGDVGQPPVPPAPAPAAAVEPDESTEAQAA